MRRPGARHASWPSAAGTAPSHKTSPRPLTLPGPLGVSSLPCPADSVLLASNGSSTSASPATSRCGPWSTRWPSLSLLSSDWARAYYDQQRARGHAHHQALRALGAKWLKIIFVMWHRQVPYDEQYHFDRAAAPATAAASDNHRLT